VVAGREIPTLTTPNPSLKRRGEGRVLGTLPVPPLEKEGRRPGVRNASGFPSLERRGEGWLPCLYAISYLCMRLLLDTEAVVTAMQTEAFFAERKAVADNEAFLRVLNREGGEPPRAGDELPDS